MKNKLLRRIALGLLLLAWPSGSLSAQSVIFPQQAQAGTAVGEENGDTFTLRNDLLTAAFVRQGGTLVFGGCEAMNLVAGTPVFSLERADGVLSSADMTLESVTLEALSPNTLAARGSEKLGGQAIKAIFTSDGLRAEWKAVLRDGSHYLRTELTLTADGKDVPMRSITPMLYTVDVATAGSTPKVVGNTRGAVLASDRIFAGLETPMGINTIEAGNMPTDDFTPKSWTPESWTWTPGAETPQGILDLGYANSDIVGARGYINIKEAGRQTVTFQYNTGTHRLNIVGVDLVDYETGEVLSSDYHFGYTGSQKENNVYTLDVPSAGIYIVRYFCEIKTETITSSGTITYSCPVSVPKIVYDLQPVSAAPARFAPLALSSDAALVDGTTLSDNWTPTDWSAVSEIPARISELGYSASDVKQITRPITVSEADGLLSVEFLYASGNNRLDLVGVDLVDKSGNVVASDYHFGYTGNARSENVYQFSVPFAGEYEIRYFCSTRDEALTSSGNITLTYEKEYIVHLPAASTVTLRGLWSRNTTLAAGTSWQVGAVVGLMAEGQARRSFLAYSERERAVPWRPMPVYVSWYELNIDRNNSADYSTTMTVEQCTDVVQQWKTNLYDRYGVAPEAFMWDDGWDNYGTWTFNPHFPNGFSEPDAVARQMGSGMGAWLGPVGGYGTSGTYRRNYWNGKGGMQLSNPAYYKVFLDACSSMIRDYDFRFFKYDGISAQFSSVGPDAGTTGEENAEGIINIEREVRKLKADIFLNTTVGTWASPFWFQFSDAVWRQENDYGTIGNQGSDRERWITYRDRLVYQNYVTNSPLCPINTLMTHGFILSKWGNVSKDMDYAGIVRELRCAFACGSGMVELYNDYELTNNINGGALWGEIADCIKWQRKNRDVLPDAHWVGGNPWDGSKANVYGWASWNGIKATLALRNPAASAQTFTTTLRAALDIPAYVSGSIILSDAFAQDALEGLTLDQAIDIDAVLTLRLAASSVYVYDGIDSNATDEDLRALLNAELRALYDEASAFAAEEPAASAALLEKFNAELNKAAAELAANTATEATIESLTAAYRDVRDAVGRNATLAVLVGEAEAALTQFAFISGTPRAALESLVAVARAEVLAKTAENETIAALREALAAFRAASVITSLDMLSNDAVYTISSERGYLVHAADFRADEAWCSGNSRHRVTVDADNPETSAQWAVFCVDGQYHLYNIGAGKFLYKNGSGGTLLTEWPQAGDTHFLAATGANKAAYPWVIAFGDNQINMSVDQETSILTSWNNTADAGNMVALRQVGTSEELQNVYNRLHNYLTGIDAPVPAASEVPAVIYDLSGRRVSQAARGLYIVGGKKALVR